MDVIDYALRSKDRTAGGISYDPEQTYAAGTVGAALSSISDEKVAKPAAEIPAGYVPVSDGQGGYTWADPQALFENNA